VTVSSQPRIIIFTGASCPWCSRVKEYLKRKKFRFREVNVEKNRDGAKELQRRNIKGVPVVMINNRAIVGFDKVKIDKLLGIK